MIRPIDAHVHLGNLTKLYDLARLRRDLDEAACEGAAVFAFPEDMYRRVDSPDHRERANRYVLEFTCDQRAQYRIEPPCNPDS